MTLSIKYDKSFSIFFYHTPIYIVFGKIEVVQKDSKMLAPEMA